MRRRAHTGTTGVVRRKVHWMCDGRVLCPTAKRSPVLASTYDTRLVTCVDCRTLYVRRLRLPYKRRGPVRIPTSEGPSSA